MTACLRVWLPSLSPTGKAKRCQPARGPRWARDALKQSISRELLWGLGAPQARTAAAKLAIYMPLPTAARLA
eukprot:4678010-Pyramimonas_sp.AAC.1